MSGRYVKINYTSNWGDSYVCMTRIFFHVFPDNPRLNVSDMTHTDNSGAGTPTNISTDDESYWQLLNSFTPNWLKIDLGVSCRIGSVTLQGLSGYPNRVIKDFTVSISNNDSDYTTILTGQTINSASAQIFYTSEFMGHPDKYRCSRGRNRMKTTGVSVPLLVNPDKSYLSTRRDRFRTQLVSIPWTPKCITGMIAWHAADHITGLSDGDSISSWENKSNNAALLYQNTTSNKPVYKTNIVNGLPAILFDGSDDYIKTWKQSKSVKSVVIVMKYTLSTFNAYDGLLTEAASTYYMVGTSGGTGWYSPPSGFTSYKDGVQTNNAMTGAWHVIIGTYTTGITNALYIGTDRLASGRYWDGYIAEVIMYDSVLTASQISLVTRYLRNKYAI